MSTDELVWLRAAENSDRERWVGIWESTEARRPHDHPSFLELMGNAQLAPAAAFHAHSSGSRILYPFYIRSLAGLPGVSATEKRLVHIVSPYGYGGPLFQGPPEFHAAASRSFEQAFSDRLRREGCVSEFVREDIFQERLAERARGEKILQQNNVVVGLGKTREQHWTNYKQKVRKNVNRAVQAGLEIVYDDTGAMLDEFLSVYYRTMERTGAAEGFIIPAERFEAFNREMRSRRSYVYAHVVKGSRVISTELILLSADSMYSFLGGTLEEHFPDRPNDFLKHETILWGGGEGYRYYVLGGGVRMNDGIFQYKECFDPGNLLPFFVRKLIHDEVQYRKLMQDRRAHEKSCGSGWAPREDFFPGYLG